MDQPAHFATSEPFPKQEGQLRLPAGAGGMGGLVGALSGAAAGGGAQGGAGAWASDDDEEMMPLRSGPGRDRGAQPGGGGGGPGQGGGPQAPSRSRGSGSGRRGGRDTNV